MKLVVFDVDGTLVDSQQLIHEGMKMAFADQGLQCPPREEVLSTIGLSLSVAMGQLAPEADEVAVAKLVQSYKEVYLTSRISDTAPLYPGALDCLDASSEDDELMLAIATGKGKHGLSQMIEVHGLQNRFISMQTADDHPSKPHPAMLLAAMSECGVEPPDAIMIGDTSFDMEMAQAAEMAGFGVSWGYHPVEALREAGAARVVPDFPALTAAIREWAA